MIIANWEITMRTYPSCRSSRTRGRDLVLDGPTTTAAIHAIPLTSGARLGDDADRSGSDGHALRTSAARLHWQLRLLGPGHYSLLFHEDRRVRRKYAYRATTIQEATKYKGIRPGTEAELVNLPVIDRRLENAELPPNSLVAGRRRFP